MATSPVPAQMQVTFDFPQSVRELLAQKKVTRLEWGNAEYFLQIVDTHVKIHKPDGKFYDLIVTDGDLSGTDWIILE